MRIRDRLECPANPRKNDTLSKRRGAKYHSDGAQSFHSKQSLLLRRLIGHNHNTQNVRLRSPLVCINTTLVFLTKNISISTITSTRETEHPCARVRYVHPPGGFLLLHQTLESSPLSLGAAIINLPLGPLERPVISTSREFLLEHHPVQLRRVFRYLSQRGIPVQVPAERIIEP